jgi:hypothetical protein
VNAEAHNITVRALPSLKKLIRDKWLNMNKQVACTKIMKITNRTHIQNVGKYSDIFKNKWFSKAEDM